jgi:hypothetical protein
MNIQTVAENLRNTIAGKEQLLKQHHNTLELYKRGAKENTGVEMAINATVQFLDINIGELKRILQDVEQCMPKVAKAYTMGDWTRDLENPHG